jgi:hypothetical protein
MLLIPNRVAIPDLAPIAARDALRPEEPIKEVLLEDMARARGAIL